MGTIVKYNELHGYYETVKGFGPSRTRNIENTRRKLKKIASKTRRHAVGKDTKREIRENDRVYATEYKSRWDAIWDFMQKTSHEVFESQADYEAWKREDELFLQGEQAAALENADFGPDVPVSIENVGQHIGAFRIKSAK